MAWPRLSDEERRSVFDYDVLCEKAWEQQRLHGKQKDDTMFIDIFQDPNMMALYNDSDDAIPSAQRFPRTPPPDLPPHFPPVGHDRYSHRRLAQHVNIWKEDGIQNGFTNRLLPLSPEPAAATSKLVQPSLQRRTPSGERPSSLRALPNLRGIQEPRITRSQSTSQTPFYEMLISGRPSLIKAIRRSVTTRRYTAILEMSNLRGPGS